MSRERSKQAYERAAARMPGGVNSPARAFRAVGVEPIFFTDGEGAHLTDVDGNHYVDFVGGFGPMILGHGHPEVVRAVHEQVDRGLGFGLPTEGETALAERIAEHVPSIERLRLVSSGTEAAMSAFRAARGYTGRSKVIKAEGNYHGHADFLLVKAGSGAMTHGHPSSAGVTDNLAADTLLAPFNDLEAVRRLLEEHAGDVAAVAVEPVPGNMGVTPPESGYLQGLRELTREHGALLVFDEVMSGFRLGLGGAQGRYGVTPDVTCLGKVIGGGLPVGAYGGPSEMMAKVSPEGPVYQAGTNSGNPLTVAAGVTTLDVLARDRVHDRLETLGDRLEQGLDRALREASVPACLQRIGSMWTIFFAEGPVRRAGDAGGRAAERFAAFWRGMLDRGILLPPSQFEAAFISAAHDEGLIDRTVGAAHEALAEVPAT